MAKKSKYGLSTAPRDKPKKRPGRHKKSRNKQEKRQQKKQKKGGHNHIKSYILGMKEKIITIKVDGALPGQWSSLLLELNLMKRAWKSYGVDITMKAPGLKNVLTHGTKVNDTATKDRRSSK